MSEREVVTAGLAYTAGAVAQWTWYIGTDFGHELLPKRAKALDALDSALMRFQSEQRALGDAGKYWRMGNDLELNAWLKSQGRAAEIPLGKAGEPPKQRTKARKR